MSADKDKKEEKSKTVTEEKTEQPEIKKEQPETITIQISFLKQNGALAGVNFTPNTDLPAIPAWLRRGANIVEEGFTKAK